MLLFVWRTAWKNRMSGSCLISPLGIACKLYCSSVSRCWQVRALTSREKHWRTFSDASVPSDNWTNRRNSCWKSRFQFIFQPTVVTRFIAILQSFKTATAKSDENRDSSTWSVVFNKRWWIKSVMLKRTKTRQIENFLDRWIKEFLKFLFKFSPRKKILWACC